MLWLLNQIGLILIILIGNNYIDLKSFIYFRFLHDNGQIKTVQEALLPFHKYPYWLWRNQEVNIYINIIVINIIFLVCRFFNLVKKL